MYSHEKNSRVEFTSPVRSIYPTLLLVLVETFSNLLVAYAVAFVAGIVLLVYNYIRQARSLYLLLCEQMALLVLSFVILWAVYPVPLYDYRACWYHSIMPDAVAWNILWACLISVPLLDRLRSQGNPQNIPNIRINLRAFRQVTYTLQFVFLLRITLFLLYHYQLITFNAFDYEWRLQGITFAAIVLVVLYDEVRFYGYRRMLAKECFIPIVDESGKVIGREALSLVLTKNNPYLHPLVRVYFLQRGKLYLQKKTDKRGSLLWDTAVSDYVCYGDEITATAVALMNQSLTLPNVTPRYITKYIFKDGDNKQLVFLFFVDTDLPLRAKDTKVLSEQLWSNDQILQSSSSNIFSEKLMKELPYLRTLTDLK